MADSWRRNAVSRVKLLAITPSANKPRHPLPYNSLQIFF
jgi:hypothetical protein